MKTNIIRYAVSLCVFVFLMSALSHTAAAQEFRGSISGSVTDPNGAVVPGATVTVKNVETSIANSITTNDSGAFTVPFLLPGKYTVTVANTGFKTSVLENVTVGVDDRLSLDFKLEIGQTAEVNIVAGSELVDKGSATLGTSISLRQIEELPLAEGAPYTLATQAPGVVYTGDPNFQGPTANGNLAGFRTNGTAGNQINLDGSPNLAYSGQVAFTPPSDAVQEFKVQTNSFDTQNGFTAGSTVNVAIKSGTNKLHGSAYWFNRDKSRTANNFFNNRQARPRPERKYDRYGVVLNGPVRLPFIYDGRDKTFFLFSFERQKDNVAQPQSYSVPTLLMRQGNFTELGTTLIYDPATAQLQGSNCTGSGTTVCRTPFPGNIIPANRIYAPAQAFLRLFPEPNTSGITNNYLTDQNLHRPYRSYMVKIDHNFDASNRLSGKVYHSRNTEDRYNLTLEPGSIFQGFENRRNNGGNLNYTSTLSSDFILDIRGSWNQFRLRRYQGDFQPSAADLGFTGVPAIRRDDIFPRFDFRNYMTAGSQRADYNEGQDRPFDLFSLQPTLTQVVGNQTIKYGYDYRKLHERFFTGGNTTGRFLTDGTYTMQASNSGSTQRDIAGRDIASFLLGLPVSGSIDNPTEYDTSSEYHALFIQNDFRVSQKLTVNFGLRYDYETGVREKEGRIVTGFDTLVASPIAAQALANYNSSVPLGVPLLAFSALRGGLTFASDADAANQRADKNNIQPRIGAAYSINDKTVIRGGYGIFTAPFQIQAIFQPGFSTPTTYTPTTNNGLTFIANLQNLFPNGIRDSVGTAQGLMTFAGRDVTAANATGPTSFVLNNDRRNAQYERFVLGFQRELPFKIGFEATYILSRGYDLAVSRELNAINPAYLNNFAPGTPAATITAAITATNTFLNATVSNPLRGLIPDGGTWNANTIARRRLLVPFPQFGNIAITQYNGKSKYEALQLQLVKRFTGGLSVNGSYTFNREHETVRYLNPQDSELTEQVSPTERPHRFTISSIYELPIGRNRFIGKDWHPALDAVFGGWQLQGVYEWQSGEPLSFGNVYYSGDPYALESLLGKKDSQGRRYGVDIPAWDRSGFYLGGVVAAANVPAFANNYTSGSANTLRSFPLATGKFRNQRFLKFDVGLSKSFRIREGMKVQLRVEAINVLNTPYFSAPNLDPTSANFGFSSAPTRQPPRDIQIGGKFTF
jgi:hypothetical protein